MTTTKEPQFKYDLHKMCKWERQKACFLLEVADDLNLNLDCYGELSVNPNSGYTYLWLEDYDFCLYMPISCDLSTEDVYVMWTNPEDGEEHEIVLGNQTLKDIEAWAEGLRSKYLKD